MIPGLTEEQRDALDRLARCVDPSTYLAGGVAVALLEDLMSMKLSAIASRGAARDFWDLDAMLAHTDTQLSEALNAFERKYATHDRGHVVKSLVYFADADSAPLPAGLDPSDWARIKAAFVRRVEVL